MAVKYAFAKNPPNLKDKFICWWRHGPYFHTEVILAENADGTYTIASAVPGTGVRTAYNQQLPADQYDILEGPGDLDAAKAWFQAHDGEGYDWFGLLGFVFSPIKDVARNKWWCSNADLTAAGLTESAWRFDPNSMYALIKDLSMVPA
jgi:hypothetical protein